MAFLSKMIVLKNLKSVFDIDLTSFLRHHSQGYHIHLFRTDHGALSCQISRFRSLPFVHITH